MPANHSIKKNLPPGFDIFSALPESVYKNERVGAFLDEMKKSLVKKDQREFRGVVLPNLFLSENTKETIVIEWIFKDFRLYFLFDAKEGDYYGEIVNDSEKGVFHNCFNKMNFEKFPDIAEAEINFAIEQAKIKTRPQFD